MQFDECTAYEVEGRITGEAEARRSMEMSLRWAVRSKAEFDRLENPNALFGIVQGGMFEGLREASIAGLADLDLPGYAIGGVSVGEPQQVMLSVVSETAPALPAAQPRYLMGVGTPEDLLEAVARGEGPKDVIISLGYAGWSAGQLEEEIAQNAWLTVAADPHVLFDTPAEGRLPAAMRLLGIDYSRLSGDVGHA